ncbi:MAG: LamB/YcsF family protein [Myxococcales bacterium]|nr:LamB/YcsF family protein [Myxococcales bacterium]
MLLGIDLGELPDESPALYRAAHIAYIAAGGHAGDDDSIVRAIDTCLVEHTRIGAHPGFADRENFGRIELALSPIALAESVAEQCARVARSAHARGARVEYVKLHGALYHCADRDERVAKTVVDAAIESLGSDLTFVAWPKRATANTVSARGIALLREGFADRAVRSDGTLVPRSEPGAVIVHPPAAVERARELLGSGAIDVLCVHGDNERAVSIATAVRAMLDARGAL